MFLTAYYKWLVATPTVSSSVLSLPSSFPLWHSVWSRCIQRWSCSPHAGEEFKRARALDNNPSRQWVSMIPPCKKQRKNADPGYFNLQRNTTLPGCCPLATGRVPWTAVILDTLSCLETMLGASANKCRVQSTEYSAKYGMRRIKSYAIRIPTGHKRALRDGQANWHKCLPSKSTGTLTLQASRTLQPTNCGGYHVSFFVLSSLRCYDTDSSSSRSHSIEVASRSLHLPVKLPNTSLLHFLP